MLQVADVVKSYDGKPLLRGVSFAVQQDETVCLLGPSGSGKSTLLLIIAGLETQESGRVLWDGADLAPVPTHRRDFGLVFQDYALFPHLDVFENVAFGLRMKKWSKDMIRSRVPEVLGVVNLSGFERRTVTELSGGEQQRVALARALAPHPRLLMFDEPLGALDRALREELLDQLRRILQEAHLPSIYVTHDQSEAAAIADRVILLHDGAIVRDGTIADVWMHPGSEWAAGFLGSGKTIDGRVLDGHAHVQTLYGVFSVECTHGHPVGQAVKLLARPDHAATGNIVRGRVVDVVFQQDRFRVTLDNGFFTYTETAPEIGQEISAGVQLECLE
ncbi:MAG TPA: ABC transporter ATP-binding protein [Anaerolineales bacterium]